MKKNLKQTYYYNSICEEKKENNLDENNLRIDGIIKDLKEKGYNDHQIKEIISSIQKNNNIFNNKFINYINDQQKKNSEIKREREEEHKMNRNNSYKNKTNNKQRNKYNNYNTKIYISKNVSENKDKLFNDIIPKKKLSEKLNTEISKPLLISKNEYLLSNKKISQNDIIQSNVNIIKRNKFNESFNDIKNNFNNYSFYFSNNKITNNKEINNYVNDYGKKINHKGKKILKYRNKKQKNNENKNININNMKDNKCINSIYLNKDDKRKNSKNILKLIENPFQEKNNNSNFNDNEYIQKNIIISENNLMNKQKSDKNVKNNLFNNYIKGNYNSINQNIELNNKVNNYEYRPINTYINNSKNYNNYIFHDISKDGSSNNSISIIRKKIHHYDSNICIKKEDLNNQENKNENSVINNNFNESFYKLNSVIKYKNIKLNKKKPLYNNISQKVICDLNYRPKKKRSTNNKVSSLSVEHNTVSIIIEPSYQKEEKKTENIKNISNFFDKERKRKDNNLEICKNQNLKFRNKSENKIINKLKIEKNEINYISNKKNFKDGLYEGIIINGKREIKGIMKYKNGSIYEGQWKNDKRHGRGLYTTQNYNNPNVKGILYEGEFNNDKIEGYGIGKYSSGDKYEGEWKNNKQYGRGTLNYVGGGKYIGEWINGKLNGDGIYYLKNGERFEGKFMDNKYNGYGKYYYQNGDYLEGIFKDDLPIGDCILHKIDGTTEDKHFI